MSIPLKTSIDQKATSIYKIVKFVDWPNESSMKGFLVKIVGSYEAYESISQVLQGKQVQGKTFATSFVENLEEALPADVLVIGDGTAINPSTAQTVAASPVLTISLSRSPSLSSIITFNGSDAQFEVNLPNARKAGIEVSYQLLQVANRVVK